jgi:hypothetical protein
LFGLGSPPAFFLLPPRPFDFLLASAFLKTRSLGTLGDLPFASTLLLCLAPGLLLSPSTRLSLRSTAFLFLTTLTLRFGLVAGPLLLLATLSLRLGPPALFVLVPAQGVFHRWRAADAWATGLVVKRAVAGWDRFDIEFPRR